MPALATTFVSLSLLASALAAPRITSSGKTAKIGKSYTITWEDGEGDVQIELKQGDENNLENVELITSEGSGGKHVWTPPAELKPGTYSLQISDESGDSPNFDALVIVAGDGGSAEDSETKADGENEDDENKDGDEDDENKDGDEDKDDENKDGDEDSDDEDEKEPENGEEESKDDEDATGAVSGSNATTPDGDSEKDGEKDEDDEDDDDDNTSGSGSSSGSSNNDTRDPENLNPANAGGLIAAPISFAFAILAVLAGAWIL